jgi:hypothetical protein
MIVFRLPMIISSFTPMHHLTIVVSSAAAGGALASGGCRDSKQGLRPGVHLEAGGPRPGQGRSTGVGLFVPKPSRAAACQRCGMPDLGTTVHQRALASTVGDGDCYSLGYSVARTCSGDSDAQPFDPALSFERLSSRTYDERAAVCASNLQAQGAGS